MWYESNKFQLDVSPGSGTFQVFPRNVQSLQLQSAMVADYSMLSAGMTTDNNIEFRRIEKDNTKNKYI